MLKFTFGDDSTPVACFVLGTIGGIVSKSAAKAAGRLNGNSALWDDCPRFKMPAHNVVFNPRGMMPDCAAQALSDAGLIRDAYVGTMWDELRKERSEEHTSELQSLRHLVCRLLLEKKK